MEKNKKYEDFLHEHLQDHNEAVALFKCRLEESLKADEESQQLFLSSSFTCWNVIDPLCLSYFTNPNH